MRYSETKIDENVLQTLLRLSADWEAEQSCWGYRANTPEDLKGRRVFIAEKENEIAAYLFGLVEQSSRASSVMPDGTPYPAFLSG